MTIKIFPSALPGEPIETHDALCTLHDWLTENCPSYRPNGGEQPIAVFADGVQIDEQDWKWLACDRDIEIRPKARGFDPFTIAIIAFVAAVGVSFLLRPNIPRIAQNAGRRGNTLQEAALTANAPKPNGVIPELAGRHKIFPDYLMPPRRYFTSPTKQAMDVMLCIGRGEFDIDPNDIRIGESRTADLQEVIDYEIFQPGQGVNTHPAHKHWYSAPEVGASVGGAGLRLIAGQASTTQTLTSSSYAINGQTITVDSGAIPADWESGAIVIIETPIRSIDIIGGAGSDRDIIQGALGDLGLAVGDMFILSGVNPGAYRVASITYGAPDEMTMDVWRDDLQQWQPAISMTPGTYSGVDIQRAKQITEQVYQKVSFYWTWVTVIKHVAAGYRVTDKTGDTLTFERLLDNGAIDPAWVGFYADTTITDAVLTLESGSIVGGWIGPFRATPADEITGVIEVDVFAPQGIGYVNDSGEIEPREKTLEVQYRGDGGPWKSALMSETIASRDQVGFTRNIILSNPSANVEVRMRRVGAEQTDLKHLDRLEWYGLRSFLGFKTPNSYPGVTTMAITINGSDAIASATENQINLIATRKINGVATRSIADWVQHVCDDIGYGADDIDGDEIARLGAIWDARGDTFDYVFSDQSTVRDALAMALRAGYSELTIDDGRIRPVRDEPRTTFEHVYTPQNMTAPLVRQFVSYDPDDHDGVDIEYVDSTTWATETVECRLPGDAGVRVRKIQADGITDRTRAWRLGMRQRRIDAYRRKRYSFSTEWDALNSRYLSYCALADDVPGYGQSSMLRAIAAVSGGYVLTLSEPMTWKSGASHVIGLRRPDGTLCGPFPAARIDDYRAKIFGSLDFSPITAASSTEPTHALFGTSARWSYPALITEITPHGDSVDVTAANYDARIYADDDNAPS